MNTSNQNESVGEVVKKTSTKMNKKTLMIVGGVIVLVVAGFLGRKMLIAATVDGSPISRLAVISELERQSGKAALEALINERLISNEAKTRKVMVGEDVLSGEVKKIEDQVTAQGEDFNTALKEQGLTLAELRSQIKVQKEVETMLSEKVTVTDAEVNQYIKDNKVTLPKGGEADMKAEIKEEIRQQKLGEEARTLIQELRAKAKINYLVSY